jgi:cytochrome c oxidase subunit II
VSVIMLAVIYAGLVHHINPPSNFETIDPNMLHLTGEFTESNLGTRVAAGGQVTSRIVATQFTLQPQCITVPKNRSVTLRFATPDVIHGILVTGTNVNTMVVPGYVSQVHTVFTKTGDLLMPCHEFCGLGHSEMWATVRVVSEDDFKPDRNGKVSCDVR